VPHDLCWPDGPLSIMRSPVTKVLWSVDARLYRE
jgi:hypothetical protein